MTKILIDEAVVRQALDASESFADGIYYENEEDDIGRRFCCGVLSYKPHKENCAAAASAAALRQTLANEALDKMAENAREMGLSYEQPAPVQPITQAVHTLIQAMQDDPEYAWSWHCNIAMAFVDAGGDRYTANQGAARFLELFAKVPPAHELPAQEPDPDELTIAYMSGLHEGKKRKPWVGLTDEEFVELCSADLGTAALIRAVEAKLKEKNT